MLPTFSETLKIIISRTEGVVLAVSRCQSEQNIIKIDVALMHSKSGVSLFSFSMQYSISLVSCSYLGLLNCNIKLFIFPAGLELSYSITAMKPLHMLYHASFFLSENIYMVRQAY